MSPSLLKVGPIFDSLFLGGLDEKEKNRLQIKCFKAKIFQRSGAEFIFLSIKVHIFC